jgi:hypothetical protein
MRAEPPPAPANIVLLRRARLCIAIVIVGLFASGVTAFPLEHEVRWGCQLLGIPPGPPSAGATGMRSWLARVRTGLERTDADYPFLAYGTDWLAFAHLALAVLFVGPYRDPARNAWVIDFGLIACCGVLALALIAGPVRGIPLGWRCIDCSFGVAAAVPLWIARRAAEVLNGRSVRPSPTGER